MSGERVFEVDEAQLVGWGRRLGASLRDGDVLLLVGPMGAGKTTLARAVAEGLGVARPQLVSSPTYTVCRVHRGPIEMVHVDLFRLLEGAESGDSTRVFTAAFDALGLDHDELPGPGQILVVEWGDAWADPPADHLRIDLERSPDREQSRRIRLVGAGRRWSAELPVEPNKT